MSKNTSDNSGDSGNEEQNNSENPRDPMEEMFRQMFGQQPGSGSGDEGGSGKGPGMGFTGTPGSGSSGDSGQGGGMPFGFDPSAMGMPQMDPQMMQQIMGQVQAMFQAAQNPSPEDQGPVNWTMARQAARQAAAGDDPSVSAAERKEIDDALRLAEMWLDAATTFEPVGQIGQAWSRAQWVEETFDSWKQLTAPVAESVSRAMSQAIKDQLGDSPEAGMPPELQSMLGGAGAGQFTSMIESMGGMAFGMQLGQAVGELSKDVHCSSDIGLPMAGHAMALLPKNISEFGKGLQIDKNEILLFLALREAARIRLFVRSPWLSQDMFNAVAQYAAGIRIDMDRVEQAASQIDPSNPESMNEVFAEGLFAAERTEMQEAALKRIETTLALVEGWVDDVVSQAAEHLDALPQLREMLNRRRATGGPAEHAFAALVGLELRPRRLRDAAALWAHLRETEGMTGRDDVWAHPDVQPDEQDLDDPQGYQARRAEREEETAKIDEELQKLLDGGYEGPGKGSSESGS